MEQVRALKGRFIVAVGSMKFLKWAAIAILVVLPLAEVVSHFVVQRTDAYRALDQFVQASEDIRGRVGDRPKMNLHVFGYSVKVSGPGGTAEFSVSVKGSRGSGELHASLIKAGDWKTVSASFDGQEIQVAALKPSPTVAPEK